LGGYYQVRQLLAHSWVEAYIGNEDRWQTIDPTPGEARLIQVQAQRSWRQKFSELIDAVRTSWLNNVVGFTYEQQSNTLAQIGEEALETLRAMFRGEFSRLAQHLSLLTRVDVWLSPIGVCLLVLLLGFWVGLRWLFRIGRRPALPKRGESLYWPLYNEWLDLLEKHGFRKPVHQTPLEFANSVATTFREDPRLRSLNQVPVDWANAYYQMRFGKQDLPPEQIRELEGQLRTAHQAFQS
jgi:hypothetical protein